MCGARQMAGQGERKGCRCLSPPAACRLAAAAAGPPARPHTQPLHCHLPILPLSRRTRRSCPLPPWAYCSPPA